MNAMTAMGAMSAMSAMREMDAINAIQFISLRSVVLALKERSLWSRCAAMGTDRPLDIGPNLRLL